MTRRAARGERLGASELQQTLATARASKYGGGPRRAHRASDAPAGAMRAEQSSYIASLAVRQLRGPIANFQTPGSLAAEIDSAG